MTVVFEERKKYMKTKTPNVLIEKHDGTSSFAISDSDKTKLYKHHISAIFKSHLYIYFPYNLNSVKEFLHPHYQSLTL